MADATAKFPAGAAGSRAEGIASIAAGIAENLTKSREGTLEAPREEQPAKEPEATTEEVRPIAEAAQPAETPTEPEPSPDVAPQGMDDSDADEDTPTEADRYSIADFADAAGTAGEDFESRLYVTVKGPDGALREVSIAELRNGYRWNAANTQNAQQNAEQRKALDARFSEVQAIQDQAEAVITAQSERIDAAEAHLQKQIEATDWGALQAARDGSYADAQAYVQARKQEIADERARVQGARDGVTESRAKMREQYMAETVPKAREALLEMIPEWRNEETARIEGQEVANFALSQGFTAEEFNACLDPRMFRMFRNAWMMSKREAAGKAARKRVEKAPKLAVKPGRRVTAEESRAKERAEVLSRADSGRTKDIAAVILHDMQQANRR